MPLLFWSGNGTREAAIRDVRRTLEAVYPASGVKGACSHRFRHTLATKILEVGGRLEEAADILGDTETIVRKRTNRDLVDEMGFEPTTPALRTPCSPS